MKKWWAGPVGKSLGGVGVSQRHALVPAGGDAVVETVDLQAAVVTAGVVAGVGHHAERAAVELHDDRGGVDVAVLGEQRIALHGAGGVHLDGALPGDPVEHVEVVHGAVAEDAARALDVVHWRGSGIHRGAAHRVEDAERPVVDGALGGRERRVVPALVADLDRHAGGQDRLGDAGALGGRRGDRLLAERGDAAFDGGQGQLRVGGRGGGDHDAVDAGGQQLVDGRDVLGAVLGGDGLGDVSALVGDHQPVDTVEAAEGFGVEGADAAQSDYAEGGHGILLSLCCCECDVECFWGEAVGEGGQHGVDLAGRREAADRLVPVEVGGERVALGGRVDRVADVAIGASGGLHGQQRRVDGAHHRGAVHRLHRAPERRRDLQQVGHPADVGRGVGARSVHERGVEEHRVALAQRHLHLMGGEVVDELLAGRTRRIRPRTSASGAAASSARSPAACRSARRRPAASGPPTCGACAPGRPPADLRRRSRGGSRGAEPAGRHRD